MESGKYYVIGYGNNLYESLTKEEILAAITQAVETHTISDVDTGFVTTVKEQNANQALKFWVGTSAQYNAIAVKDPNCFYILTDDVELEDLEQQIAQLSESVDLIAGLRNKVILDTLVNYGDNLSVLLSGTENIADCAVVKVTAAGAGDILCSVQVTGTTVSIKGTGNAAMSNTSGTIFVTINLTCNSATNTLTRNFSTSTMITASGSVSINQQSINRIIGVM